MVLMMQKITFIIAFVFLGLCHDIVNAQTSSQEFKVTNWNVEWLGCTQFGPEDEELQINNVAQAMLLMDADVYCLQEVINTDINPSVATLVSIMGSDEWAGNIVPSLTGDCNQRQAIIYKKSKVEFESAMQLNNGDGAEGNSYYYNWSSGRYPALYNINFISGDISISVSLINIHSKAEDGNASSYYRRRGGSTGLKTVLDGSDYNTKNLMIIGDFNDYLIGTTSDACNCTESPFKNFMDDPANYTPITQNLLTGGWNPHPIIENILISNELTDNYVTNSAMREIAVAETISNFSNTTSDHLPVSAKFQFEIPLDTPNFTETSWSVYPNPVDDVLTIVIPDSVVMTTATIRDITGRPIYYTTTADATINVSHLPAGIYFLTLGNSSTKFVKQ
jgi:endonuclease/exonuclease/phosphatase family metal-dependent hydrolase